MMAIGCLKKFVLKLYFVLSDSENLCYAGKVVFIGDMYHYCVFYYAI